MPLGTEGLRLSLRPLDQVGRTEKATRCYLSLGTAVHCEGLRVRNAPEELRRVDFVGDAGGGITRTSWGGENAGSLSDLAVIPDQSRSQDIQSDQQVHEPHRVVRWRFADGIYVICLP